MGKRGLTIEDKKYLARVAELIRYIMEQKEISSSYIKEKSGVGIKTIQRDKQDAFERPSPSFIDIIKILNVLKPSYGEVAPLFPFLADVPGDTFDGSEEHKRKLNLFLDMSYRIAYLNTVDTSKPDVVIMKTGHKPEAGGYVSATYTHLAYGADGNMDEDMTETPENAIKYNCKIVCPPESSYAFIHITSESNTIRDKGLIILPCKNPHPPYKIHNSIGVMLTISTTAKAVPCFQKVLITDTRIVSKESWEKFANNTARLHNFLKIQEASSTVFRFNNIEEENQKVSEYFAGPTDQNEADEPQHRPYIY